MFYRRNLPHWQPATAMLFITAHAAGSLPVRATAQLRAMQAEGDDSTESARRLFAWYERSLEEGRRMVHPFAEAAAAEAVKAAILAEEAASCHILAWIVMPNHIHLLVGPLLEQGLEPAASLMRRIKGRSARAVNMLTGRHGRLWQPESFDRWMRNDGNIDNTVGYIERNPVVAGLCRQPEDWCWSSARKRSAG